MIEIVTENLNVISGGALFLGTLLYSRLDHKRKKELKRLEAMKQKDPDHRTLREYYKRTKKLDPTKRKSLQPTNQIVMPAGWTDEDEKQWETSKKIYEVTNPEIQETRKTVGHPVRRNEKNGIAYVHPEEYFHKFFGGRLVLENQELLTGLTNKMHRLEITKDNKVYVDGTPVRLDPQTLDRLKSALDKTQER